jgi:putative ABC transport system permease protein
MMEFLLESAFLCVIGGMIGLAAVFLLTVILSPMMAFKLSIPLDIILMAVCICLFTGISAGIIPAFIAARMDPVVAIRS